MQAEDIPHFMEMEWFGKRIRESRYTVSEHVIMFMSAGKISVKDIETVMITGRVLEERRNPVRMPCYLVCGKSREKNVHIVCAKDRDNWLVILFAYVPLLPIWSSPTRRNVLRGDKMAEFVGTCYFCGGKMVEIVVGAYYYRHDGQMCVVKELPAKLCEQCGEKYINADVARKLNALIDAKQYTGTEAANVIDYGPKKDLS